MSAEGRADQPQASIGPVAKRHSVDKTILEGSPLPAWGNLTIEERTEEAFRKSTTSSDHRDFRFWEEGARSLNLGSAFVLSYAILGKLINFESLIS